MSDLLTSTRFAALRKCPRLHYWRFELGLSRIRKATPLRFGGAFHYGLELYRGGLSSDLAIETATSDYATCPDWADPTDWAVERETLAALLAGHFWRYQDDDIEFVAVEQTFEIPLVNPDTLRPSRSFTVAGKIDGIVRLPDGRLAVLEYKTAGEDISANAEYWLRLRCDGQIRLGRRRGGPTAQAAAEPDRLDGAEGSRPRCRKGPLPARHLEGQCKGGLQARPRPQQSPSDGAPIPAQGEPADGRQHTHRPVRRRVALGAREANQGPSGIHQPQVRRRSMVTRTEPYNVVMDVTPSQAANWLEGNTHNRPVTQAHVERLAAEMSAGRWGPTARSTPV